MSGVDNRIVTMQFNNRQFEQDARTSLTTLQKIKESMDFGKIVGGTVRGLGAVQGALGKIGLSTPFAPLISGANKGLGLVGGVLDKLGLKNPFATGIQSASEMQRAAQAAGGPAGMGVLEGGVTAVSTKFLALSTIAITALSNITNKAINSGTAFLKSFTFAPVMDGLREYETTLQSIQTVQANTDAPLKEVEESLQRLNDYSDTTIYNFGEMAKNVGTFTAAGVDLKTSVASIQGIANIAALSGSSSQQAATAMYQLSQAIASGKVGLMDWNSVVNAGMGGKKLQGALLQTAVAMGDISAESVKLEGPMKKLTVNGESFRESIMAKPGQESWLSSDILVNTLASLDGRFSVAYQKAQLTEDGVRKFTDAQIKSNMAEARANLEKKNGVKYSDKQYAALLKMAEASTKAAQDVKTLGQVFDIAKETIGSGWAASFKSIFGNLDESKKLFTGMSNGLGEIIRQNALARNTLLKGWSDSKLGGRDTLIGGLTVGWEAFVDVITAVSAGFRDIFPKKTVGDLNSITLSFALLMQKLTPSTETLEKIRSISGGVAAVFSIIGQVIGGVAAGFKVLFDAVGGGEGNFLSFAAGIGESIKGFDAFLENSGIITAFFEGLGKILSVPMALLRGVGSIIGNLFASFDQGAAGKVGDAVDGIGNRLSGLEVIGERIQNFFSKIGDFFGGLGGHIANALLGIGDVVAGAFTADTFGSTLDVINTTLLGGLVLLIKNFFSKGVSVDLTGGLFDGIKESLGAATSAFESMQMKLKADVLMKLAVAIGAMAAALLVLSMISPAALTKALSAMTAGFGVLIGALAVLMKVMGPAGLVQMYVVTSAMTKMAFSILLLSIALKTLSKIKFGEMLRGLLGLTVMLSVISKAMLPLAAGSKGMAKAAWSLILLGVAINILAIALKIFATMSWEEMVKGLAGLTGVLLALSIGLKKMPPLQAEAVTLIALGVAINLLAIALKIFATMSWEEMTKGILMLVGSLVGIAGAMRLMPKGMLLQAAALVAVAGAMTVLAGALKIMGSMGWEAIAKGLVVMGGAMIIIAAGLQAIGIVGTIGAVGLLAAALAMTVMLPVMVAFGAMDWMTIIKSITMLAAIFIVFGVAGLVLGPVTPVILALAAAMLVFGAGLALAGAGALAAATAFGIVVAAGAAGAQIMAQFLAAIIQAIPPAMAAFGEGIVSFAVAIGKGAPRIATAFGRVLSNLLDQVIKNVPKMGKALLTLINTGIKVVVKAAPRMAAAGLTLIIKLMEAISSRLPRIMQLGGDIIVKFLQGLGRELPDIIDAGIKVVIKFINGVADGIRENKDAMAQAGENLAAALIDAAATAIRNGGSKIKDAAVAAARAAWKAVTDFLDMGGPSKLFERTVGRAIPAGMVAGIHKETPAVVSEIEDLGHSVVNKMSQVMSGIDNAFAFDPNLNPTITPVLDLSALTKEANKMTSILDTVPIMAGVSYRTAADISAMTTAASSNEGPDDGPDGEGSTGTGDVSLTLELHSPKPIDSVAAYRGGKTLISLAKEALG